MNCREARDLLLEADRPELLGEATTELGRHVASCATCAALARRFLDSEAALDLALARVPVPQRRRTNAVLWGTFAAAAIVVLVLLPRQQPPASPARLADQRTVDVDVSSGAGRTAVVLRTADPGITVVWFFQD